MAAILSIVGAAQAPADVPSAAGSFALGVLRRDGIVIPFATFDGRRWRHDWPPPRESVEVPAALRDVPGRWWGPLGPMETWQAWIGAAAPRALRVRQPDWFAAHCYQQVGLRTDYWPSERPPGSDAQPYPKDGLAVSPPRPVARIDIVPAGDLAVTPEIRAAFNQAEHDAFDRGAEGRLLFGGSRVFGGRARRDPQPITVEAAYAVGEPGAGRTYYLELSRQYRADTTSEPSCAVAFGAGFFARSSAGTYRALSVDAAVVGCNRNDIHYMLPLGAVHVGGRLFWVGQWAGWDYEEYNVFEIKPKSAESVVQVWGGGC